MVLGMTAGRLETGGVVWRPLRAGMHTLGTPGARAASPDLPKLGIPNHNFDRIFALGYLGLAQVTTWRHSTSARHARGVLSVSKPRRGRHTTPSASSEPVVIPCSIIEAQEPTRVLQQQKSRPYKIKVASTK